MKILIVDNSFLPFNKYGGTERVIWYLGKSLSQMGHEVGYLVKQGSSCPFAKIHEINPTEEITAQIPEGYDMVHFQFQVKDYPHPHVMTFHGNQNHQSPFAQNTIFISANHAQRYGADTFVHNGLDFSDYGSVELHNPKNYFHFIGKAAWRLKNVKGAINIIKQVPQAKLKVLGGNRLNLKMGFRFTTTPKAQFHGMVGGDEKNNYLRYSKGLIFPVLWHEPFGLAITESLYYGNPVFGTPYGSLPELVPTEFGFLSHRSSEIVEAVKNVDQFSRKACHEYAVEMFNADKMAEGYLKCYERVLNHEPLNAQAPQLKKVQEEKFLPWEA
ncbi:glycosyltransferase [Persicobacter psychrovividus]|uniref:Glycosyl transferase n=1 Tax=Persicobacter psychrovividus TaxID=387638 RepID=A0ABM7VIR9_9BACT|nr:glycosyl transferase [Persicobacter psychrovividus]